MAGDPRRRVLPGQPLVIPASVYNDLLASLDARQPPGRREANRRVTQSGIVRVLNTTGSQIVLLFSVVGLNDPIIDPADNLNEFKSEVTFRGVTPDDPAHRGRFGILIEPADTDAVARAVVSGVVQVRLRPVDDGDVQDFAEVADGQTGYLVDSATGSARILWEAGGTGERWAIVRLAEKPKVSASISTVEEVNGSTDVVNDVTTLQINYGDGGDVTNPSAGIARINFLSASATQKGMVDLSDQYLGAGIKTVDVLAVATTAGSTANNDVALRVDTAGPLGFTYSVLSCQHRNTAGGFGDAVFSALSVCTGGITFAPNPDDNAFVMGPSGSTLFRVFDSTAPGYGLWFSTAHSEPNSGFLTDTNTMFGCSGLILAHKFGISGNALGNDLLGDTGTTGDGTVVVGGIVTAVGSGGGGTVTSITAGTGITCTPNPITGSGTIAVTNPATGTNTGDQLVFKTIAVSGQSDVVADTTTDTLTLAAGSGVTLTTDATTDTITITASGSGGTVTSITAGDGISCSPNPITGSGAVSVDETFAFAWTANHTWERAAGETAIEIKAPVRGTTGFDDSPGFTLTGQSYTGGVAHQQHWRQLVDVLNASGGSNWRLEFFTDSDSPTSALEFASTGTFWVYGALSVTGNAGAANLSGTNTGDQLVFKTIAVSGQSDVVADTTTDTLTLAAGSGVTITTDAATDTITVAATATGTNTGDQLVFKTIAVSGQSDVVADTTTDTLTLAAGTGVAITTDAATDTITIGVSTNGVGDAQLRQGAACSLVGRSANSTGNVADISIGSNDQILVRRSNAIAAEAVGFRLKTVTVLTSGSGATYNTPAGVLALLVELIGGGASGGGVSGSASNAAASAGGGGGGYARKFYNAPVSSYTYTVGTGGSAPTAGANNGNNGNDTTWDDGTTTVTAKGGIGGTAMAFGTSVLVANPGSGAAISTNGDLNSAGSPGGPGIRFASNNGVGGNGGNGPLGGGALGIANAAAGANGAGPGAGGAGAVTKDATNRSGGAGGDGVIIVHEYY